MRHRIFIPLLLFFCSCSSLLAQWSVGVTGGGTLSFRKWEILDIADLSYDPGLSYNAGLVGEWRASRLFALRAEAGYQVWRSRLDGLTDENGNILDIVAKDDLSAWSGALLVKITPSSRLNLYVLTGPSAARIVKNKTVLKGEGTGTEFPKSLTHDLKERGIEPNQYFVNLGIGNAFKVGSKGQITVEARYQHGLGNLSTSEVVDARISSLLVNLGYLYQF